MSRRRGEGRSPAGQKLALAWRLAGHTLRRSPLRHLTVEVTKRCNARCSFCPYWREPRGVELDGYGDIVGHFRPLVVTLSGGEPLVRRDLEDLVAGIRAADRSVYIALVTNGALLGVERAERLRRAGVDQLSVSLDYAGPRQDEVRALPGLFGHITGLLPELAGVGFDSLSLNTVIKDDNLDDIPAILELARRSGVLVGFSSYCSLKTGDDTLRVRRANLEKLREVLGTIRRYKREHRITRTSGYYLDRVEEYFTRGGIPGCQAGRNWFQVTPAGEVKPCSELPVAAADWRGYDPAAAPPVSCSSCWYSCRGESQAPVTLERIRGLL